MTSNWLDVLFLAIGGITAVMFLYCAWDMFRSWREGRAKPANRSSARR